MPCSLLREAKKHHLDNASSTEANGAVPMVGSYMEWGDGEEGAAFWAAWQECRSDWWRG